MIEENIALLLDSLPADEVVLVAVTKTQPPDAVRIAFAAGLSVMGENRVQEALEKAADLSDLPLEWHLIGHLQTNKVKYIAEFIDTIQSVDSAKLLEEINRQAAKNNRKIKVLLQVKIAEEESKFGLEIHEAKELFTDWLNGNYQNVEVEGLMGMATFTDNKAQVMKEFTFLKQIFDKMSLQKPLKILSMGMSDDYLLAIDCGANSVRIGSAIFGNRQYDL